MARQTNRSLSGLFREGLKRLHEESVTRGRIADDYPTTRRGAIDADLTASLEEFKRGHAHGPFDSVEKAAAYVEGIAKERTVRKKPRRVA